jgi:RNA polymerase sigma factor (sigma-70 family)
MQVPENRRRAPTYWGVQADGSGSILYSINSTRNSFEDSASPHWFATTHWSVVLAAGSDSSPAALEALERLCRTYWYPLYAYTRRRGFSPHDAEDLVQGFFAKLIEKEMLAGLQREGGRFRSFLLACFNHFLSDQRDSVRRLKRGGNREILSLDADQAEGRYSLEPADLVDPQKIYERRWALTVLETVLARLKAELDGEGKRRLFDELQALVVGEPGAGRQAEAAARLGLSKGAVAVTVHRLRQRYRRLLREEIAHTVQRIEEVDDEMQHLLRVLSG